MEIRSVPWHIGKVREQGGQTADLTIDAALLAASLDWPHRDPFDRLLAATALSADLTLVSADTMFDALEGQPLRRVW